MQSTNLTLCQNENSKADFKMPVLRNNRSNHMYKGGQRIMQTNFGLVTGKGF